MIALYLLIAAIAFLMLYFSLQKLTLNIDEKKALEPIKVDIYPKFCDIIQEKIEEFKDDIEKEHLILKEEDKKDEFLEKLGDLSRELSFIQTMNLSKKSDSLWQSELFDFLEQIENLLLEYLQEGEEQAQYLREFLMDAFEKLKG